MALHWCRQLGVSREPLSLAHTLTTWGRHWLMLRLLLLPSFVWMRSSYISNSVYIFTSRRTAAPQAPPVRPSGLTLPVPLATKPLGCSVARFAARARRAAFRHHATTMLGPIVVGLPELCLIISGWKRAPTERRPLEGCCTTPGQMTSPAGRPGPNSLACPQADPSDWCPAIALKKTSPNSLSLAAPTPFTSAKASRSRGRRSAMSISVRSENTT